MGEGEGEDEEEEVLLLAHFSDFQEASFLLNSSSVQLNNIGLGHLHPPSCSADGFLFRGSTEHALGSILLAPVESSDEEAGDNEPFSSSSLLLVNQKINFRLVHIPETPYEANRCSETPSQNENDIS